jgi:hypothetical protein
VYWLEGLIRSGFSRSEPAKEEEVVAAKGTPAGEQEPVEIFLDGVSHADASIIDGSAIGTLVRQH